MKENKKGSEWFWVIVILIVVTAASVFIFNKPINLAGLSVSLKSLNAEMRDLEKAIYSGSYEAIRSQFEYTYDAYWKVEDEFIELHKEAEKRERRNDDFDSSLY